MAEATTAQLAPRLRIGPWARRAATGLLLVLAPAAPTPAGAPPPPAALVEMTDAMQFEPARVTIRAGQVVEWRNDSVLVHSATLDPDRAVRPEDASLPAGAAPFDSGLLEPGARFRHRFPVPGTYRYYCLPHEAAGMTGVIVVR